MKSIGPKLWVAMTLAGAILVGCLSESPEGLTGGKPEGNARPLLTDVLGDSGGGTRGNGNDNGANGNDNGAGCNCPDFDGDGVVDLGDLTILLSAFGSSSGNSCIDMDRDGAVDLGDLTLFLSAFGSSCNGNGNGNTNDNGSTNGNDNSVPNGNDNGAPNGNDNGAPNGNDNGAPNGNDNGAPNGNDNGAPNGNDNGDNGNGNDNGTCPDGSSQFFAPLSGDSNNEAEFRDLAGGCQRFRVRVRSLQANTAFDVTINGVSVGVFVTDDRGRGELEFSPLPAGFPAVHAGDVITVGPVSGVFGDDCSANANCNG